MFEEIETDFVWIMIPAISFFVCCWLLQYLFVCGDDRVAPTSRIIEEQDAEEETLSPNRKLASAKGKSSAAAVNFASEAAGAVVLASSEECSGFTNVLSDHKDKYAMCPCSARKKWVTIGLSEDVSSVTMKNNVKEFTLSFRF